MIRGFNISTWHHPGTAKEWIREAAANGANTIRYQFTPPNIDSLKHRGKYLEFLNTGIDDLLEIANYTEANRLPIKFILDLHAPFGGLVERKRGIYHACLADRHYRQIWRNDLRLLSDVFSPQESVFALEFINEPHTFSDRRWQRQATHEARKIRKHWKKKIVLPCHGIGPKELRNLSPIPQKKILYTAHMYEPFKITHAGVFGPIDLPFPELRLKTRLSAAINWKRKYRKPLFIGEFGCVDMAGSDMQRRFITRCAKILQRNRIGWCLYPYKDRHIWNYETAGVLDEVYKLLKA